MADDSVKVPQIILPQNIYKKLNPDEFCVCLTRSEPWSERSRTSSF